MALANHNFLNLGQVLATARRYLSGEVSISELNGAVSRALSEARMAGAQPEVIFLLEEWADKVDRCWNEWEQHTRPISESELRGWLESKLMPEDKGDG